jgi:opacity protein-like surface antigen
MYKRITTSFFLTAAILFALTFIPAEKAEAQWGIGASYELRDTEPTNGFGLRVQKDILGAVPMFDLGIRAHFSYFSESVQSYRDVQDIPYELDSYDFGLAGLGGINLGFIKPYAGAGLGSESFEAVSQQDNFEFSDNSIYWNIFVGAAVTPIPVLKPFIEYRFTRLFSDDGFDHRQNGRLAIGITLEF